MCKFTFFTRPKIIFANIFFNVRLNQKVQQEINNKELNQKKSTILVEGSRGQVERSMYQILEIRHKNTEKEMNNHKHKYKT